jgi:DNA (cytosine-5)-methyltransferase 1
MGRKLRYATACTGIGGFDAGLDDNGMECVFQCEVDRDCNKVLARHWPHVTRTTDVNDDCTAAELIRLRPDWFAFGFPCQDLSVAGRRAGLAGKRSGLFFRLTDIVDACRPRGLLIENVPGLLSSNNGRDMGAVVGTLADLGYGWAYRVLDAQWFGVAQRRRRVFIVAVFGDARRAAEILFERESLPWDSAPSREAGARTTGAITRGLGSGGADDNKAQGGHVVTHTLRAEGFDASEDGTGRGTPIVPVAFAQNQRDELRNLRDCAGALAAEPGMKQQTYIAYQCHGSNIGEMGTLRRGNGSTTGGVPFIINEKGRPEGRTLEYRDDGTANALLTPSGGRAGIGVGAFASPSHGVRRLTPRECERLQGFDDDWTRWGADGEQISDSSRYRMLGNAVCRKVATWIGRRIIESLT